MIISTKGRYGLRILIDLAMHKDEGFLPLNDISKRQDISKKYLEQIVPVFVKAGILRTNRGSQGGYQLAQSPDKITISDVLRLTEGDFSPVPCVGCEPSECNRKEQCQTIAVWQGLYDVVNNYLGNITLQDIADRQNSSDNYII
ncbi:MAG: Rrf2 family transcriptional regulator [Clostridia bacterium]|nr:Rrf2 family transcriptional regulator [Clostridia bacterium]